MRKIISDTTSYVIVQVDEENDFGGANIIGLQVLRVNDFYFVGTLRFDYVLDCWLLEKVVSCETWNCREEAEKALLMNTYHMIDVSDE